MDDLKAEIWYEMQETLFVENTAVFLADRSAEAVLSHDGKKVHKPIISKAKAETYTPYQEITLRQRKAEKQTLEVDTFESANTELDDTDKAQMAQYAVPSFIAKDIMKVLNDRVEKKFLSQITGAKHVVDGETFGGAGSSLVEFSGPTIYDVFEVATTRLRTVDAPVDGRVAVLGPHDVSAIRKLTQQRETRLGDVVLSNGVVTQPWHGWTIVENNNLPWSATFTIDTNPTDGDTVTIAGVTFTFKDTLGSDAGNVKIGNDAAASRANLKAAVEGGSGAGTTYVDIDIADDHILRTKRYVRCSSDEAMAFTGYGDVVVSADMTAATNKWSNQRHNAYFGVVGSIDLVVQIDPNQIEHTRKEKGHADIWKSLLGLGAKMFADGALTSVLVKTDASTWK